MEVFSDPRVAYNYSNYYIEGFKRLGIPVSFRIDYFKEIRYEIYKQGIPFLLKKNGIEYHVFVDFHDSCVIDKSWYDWCHIYAKVNAAFEDVSRYEKLFVIGPSFGINTQNVIKDIFLGLQNYLKGRAFLGVSFKEHFANYLYPHIRRIPLNKMYPSPCQVSENYVFHASTLWYDKMTHATTNMFRGEFLKYCRNVGVEIGGGLFYIDNPVVLSEFPQYINYLDMYREFLYKRRINMLTYIHETQRSFVVFNTPSVSECHGWKLPEYLCMGKAIISTPLSRAMPGGGLQHGKHIHYVQNINDLPDAISAIRNDGRYREYLEANARAYYEEYLTPEQVVRRIIDRVVDIE